MFQIKNVFQWTVPILLVHLFAICITTVYSLDVIVTEVKKEDEIINSKKFDTRENSEEAVRPHYALDPRQSKKLARLEEKLYYSISEIMMNARLSLTEYHLCHIYLTNYFNDYKKDTKAVQGKTGVARANIVTENPNLVLRMIRRIFVTLINETLNSCEKLVPEIGRKIEKTFKKAALTPPTQNDLNDALLGLLRIQYIYGLNATSEIRLGNLSGVHTGAFLYFDDCMALADMAIETGAASMAYQWLEAARLSPPDTDRPKEHLEKDTIYLQHGWLKLLNLTKVGSWKLLHKLLKNQRQEELSGFYTYDQYATCRGEATMPIEYQSELFCFHTQYWDPYFYINPIRAELLSDDPVIFQFYNFIGDKAINFIKNLTSTMTRSGIVSPQAAQTDYNPMRTSMQSWIFDSVQFKPPKTLVNWNRRVEKLTGLEVMKEGASHALSVVLYGSLGGHYDVHNDALQNSTAPTDVLGDRIATLLTFLSDVKLGGYTAFPTAGVFARPMKGSAILWYNLKLNGLSDQRTAHCGCPVILGTKQVANRWILQYENMFKFRCSLDPTQ